MRTMSGFSKLSSHSLSPGPVVAAVAVAILCLGYLLLYFLLCERSVDEPSGFHGIAGDRKVRGYRWRWCEVAFVPVAWIEGAFRGRSVIVVCDPEWLLDS